MTKDVRKSDLYRQTNDFVAEFEQSSQPDLTQIGREFAQLQRAMIDQQEGYAATVGAKAKNRSKNRYDDILPYDQTRVILNSNGAASDYINASFVEDLAGTCRYIAAQGPTDDSIVDFFRMIWEYEISIIICPANDVEAGELKFRRYWPDRGKSLHFGVYRITQDEYNRSYFLGEDYELCPLIIDRKGSERHVLLYYFFRWFDHDIPDRAESILDLLRHVDRHRPVSHCAPILVHCSAGCGRTGTMIAIDLLHRWVTNQCSPSRTVSVFQIALHIRQFRIALIQTLRQYFFVYKVLLLVMKNSMTRLGNVDINKTATLSSSAKIELSPRSSLKSSFSRSSDLLNMILSQPPMVYDSASDTDASSSSQSPSETFSSSLWINTHQLNKPSSPMNAKDDRRHSTRSKQKETTTAMTSSRAFPSYRHHSRRISTD